MASSSQIHNFSSVCIFTGSNSGNDVRFLDAADKLGILLAEKNIKVVYGKGTSGLSDRVAACVYRKGVKVVTIAARSTSDFSDTGFTYGDELRLTHMQKRIITMLPSADAFIALPGDFGTLEELFSIASWVQLNIHHKPMGLLNIDGFYNGLLTLLDSMEKYEFISPITRHFFVSANTPEELIEKLMANAPMPDPISSHMISSSNDSNCTLNLDLSLSL